MAPCSASASSATLTRQALCQAAAHARQRPVLSTAARLAPPRRSSGGPTTTCTAWRPASLPRWGPGALAGAPARRSTRAHAGVQDIDIINKAQRGLKAGTVWVNCWVRLASSGALRCTLSSALDCRCSAECVRQRYVCEPRAQAVSHHGLTARVRIAAVPFGGFKQSGIGRDKGQDALANYTQVRCAPGSQTGEQSS